MSHTRFNELKSFKGQRYTVEDDHKISEAYVFEFKFETKKHRLRNAPKNSGAPVGTEYHWLIGRAYLPQRVATQTGNLHCTVQYVVKEDANTYTTRMEGRKYKVYWRINPSGRTPGA
ncbi:hypothetical protein ID866_3963 [Astraeus odoratus]|nr:hypothetical protein ID866_3963 [Astraeus odoratus]